MYITYILREIENSCPLSSQCCRKEVIGLRVPERPVVMSHLYYLMIQVGKLLLWANVLVYKTEPYLEPEKLCGDCLSLSLCHYPVRLANDQNPNNLIRNIKLILLSFNFKPAHTCSFLFTQYTWLVTSLLPYDKGSVESKWTFKVY